MTLIAITTADEMNRRLGRRVRNLLFDRDITQAAMALKINTTESGMSRRIRGKTEFSPYELAIIAKTLEVTVDELLREAVPSDYKAVVLRPNFRGPRNRNDDSTRPRAA